MIQCPAPGQSRPAPAAARPLLTLVNWSAPRSGTRRRFLLHGPQIVDLYCAGPVALGQERQAVGECLRGREIVGLDDRVDAVCARWGDGGAADPARRPGDIVIRVLIVDDHPVFRDGLAGLLTTLGDVEIDGSVGTAEQALDAVRHSPPNVVLMDLNLPGTSGVEATGQVLELAPSSAVLVITMVDDDDSVLAALRAGAYGYVLTGASAEEISAAIRTVAAGGAVFGVAIAGRLAAPPAPRSTAALGGDLTPARMRCWRARRRHAQQADRQNHRHLTQDRAEPRLPHPRQLQAADRTEAALRARGIPHTDVGAQNVHYRDGDSSGQHIAGHRWW